MTLKTVIYRYLKTNGVPYSEAYRMASELVTVVSNHTSEPDLNTKASNKDLTTNS